MEEIIVAEVFKKYICLQKRHKELRREIQYQTDFTIRKKISKQLREINSNIENIELQVEKISKNYNQQTI